MMLNSSSRVMFRTLRAGCARQHQLQSIFKIRNMKFSSLQVLLNKVANGGRESTKEVLGEIKMPPIIRRPSVVGLEPQMISASRIGNLARYLSLVEQAKSTKLSLSLEASESIMLAIVDHCDRTNAAYSIAVDWIYVMSKMWVEQKKDFNYNFLAMFETLSIKQQLVQPEDIAKYLEAFVQKEIYISDLSVTSQSIIRLHISDTWRQFTKYDIGRILSGLSRMQRMGDTLPMDMQLQLLFSMQRHLSLMSPLQVEEVDAYTKTLRLRRGLNDPEYTEEVQTFLLEQLKGVTLSKLTATDIQTVTAAVQIVSKLGYQFDLLSLDMRAAICNAVHVVDLILTDDHYDLLTEAFAKVGVPFPELLRNPTHFTQPTLEPLDEMTLDRMKSNLQYEIEQGKKWAEIPLKIRNDFRSTVVKFTTCATKKVLNRSEISVETVASILYLLAHADCHFETDLDPMVRKGLLTALLAENTSRSRERKDNSTTGVEGDAVSEEGFTGRELCLLLQSLVKFDLPSGSLSKPLKDKIVLSLQSNPRIFCDDDSMTPMMYVQTLQCVRRLGIPRHCVSSSAIQTANEHYHNVFKPAEYVALIKSLNDVGVALCELSSSGLKQMSASLQLLVPRMNLQELSNLMKLLPTFSFDDAYTIGEDRAAAADSNAFNARDINIVVPEEDLQAAENAAYELGMSLGETEKDIQRRMDAAIDRLYRKIRHAAKREVHLLKADAEMESVFRQQPPLESSSSSSSSQTEGEAPLQRLDSLIAIHDCLLRQYKALKLYDPLNAATTDGRLSAESLVSALQVDVPDYYMFMCNAVQDGDKFVQEMLALSVVTTPTAVELQDAEAATRVKPSVVSAVEKAQRLNEPTELQRKFIGYINGLIGTRELYELFALDEYFSSDFGLSSIHFPVYHDKHRGIPQSSDEPPPPIMAFICVDRRINKKRDPADIVPVNGRDHIYISHVLQQQYGVPTFTQTYEHRDGSLMKQAAELVTALEKERKRFLLRRGETDMFSKALIQNEIRNEELRHARRERGDERLRRYREEKSRKNSNSRDTTLLEQQERGEMASFENHQVRKDQFYSELRETFCAEETREEILNDGTVDLGGTGSVQVETAGADNADCGESFNLADELKVAFKSRQADDIRETERAKGVEATEQQD